ncbi:hypothetical protein BDP27DRAFT_1422073 [Rhodocollybia butyracea]|uniref:Uncharacterized protein n=1 Tax=Rhodocollybia butyracea TaxID=206335 RepID=A0A9P5PQU7_9AGAR|nr:hypothetical protein BDP27DRAFT_1422073 [Rhodocollybia butyracea]
MSETAHRLACFKIHGVEPSFILQHAGIFEAVRGKRKKQCDFFTLLCFCAYAKLEGILVSEAVTRLRGAPKILDFPSELYKKALKALEACNSRPSKLGRIMDERERLFAQADEDARRLRDFIAKDKAEDPSRCDDGVEKKRKLHKKTKKTKDHGRSRPLPVPTVNDRHSPLHVIIPALPRATIPTPPAPIPSSEPVPPIHVPNPSSTTDTLARMKRSAPVDPDSSRRVRPCLEDALPLAPNRAPVDMSRMIPHVPLPSQDPAAQFHSQGFNLDQQMFVADFVANHCLTIQELQEERDRAMRYRLERNQLREQLAEMTSRSAGSEAEAHVERTRAELLAVQLKELASSSAIVRKEFLKSRERTKELEKQLSQRPRIGTDFEDILHLEEENRRLRVSENSLRDDLKRAEGSFEAIQNSHDELIRRNDRIVEASHRVQWGKEAAESHLCEARYKMKLLGNMLKSSAGSSNESLVQRLQSNRELLVLECNIALEYALMLRQLDLPGFVNRFQQRVAEPLFRVYNLLHVSSDPAVAESPLFVEVNAALSNAIPSITNKACRSNWPFHSTSSRTEQTLARNAGFEEAISSIEPIFNQERSIWYGRFLQFTPDLFPLHNLRDAQGSSLCEAIRGLLDNLDVVAYSPSSPRIPGTASPSVSYSPLANPSSSPAVPVVPVTSAAMVSVGVQTSPNVVVTALQPTEDMEDLEYMSDAAVAEDGTLTGILDLDVSVVVDDGSAVETTGSVGDNAKLEPSVSSPSLFLPDPKNPLFLPSSEPSSTGSTILELP